MRAPTLIALLCLAGITQAQEPAAPKLDAAAAERSQALSRDIQYQQALKREAPTSEQRQLEFAGESQLGLFLPAARPEPLGGILLIAGPGEHANWPELIGPARISLSDAGWHTLAISLPDAPSVPQIDVPPEPAEPPAADNAAPPEIVPEGELLAASDQVDAAPEPPPEARYSERATALIRAGLQVLESEGAQQVHIIARRESAYWALLAASTSGPDQPPATLVLYQSRQPASSPEPSLDSLFEKNERPVFELLDLAVTVDSQLAADHLRIARRTGNQGYQQMDLAAMDRSAFADEMLDKRLRGWLTRHQQPAEPEAAP
ncbi:DUF3530 family protein [Halopseudomonas oceani]|uniref:DUF3530 family protein n=1 Tax=Halopseudomonas oceani TaxID=1708783 RepID=UPI002AA70217|nr:DUF3530 family protein [Halopseudomonas oceani]